MAVAALSSGPESRKTPMDERYALRSRPARSLSQIPSWVTARLCGRGPLLSSRLPRRAPVAPPATPTVEGGPRRPCQAFRRAAGHHDRGPSSPPGTIGRLDQRHDEVALWKRGDEKLLGLLRSPEDANGYYFRSITGFTSPILTHGGRGQLAAPVHGDDPQRAAVASDDINKENWRALAEGAHERAGALQRRRPSPTTGNRTRYARHAIPSHRILSASRCASSRTVLFASDGDERSRSGRPCSSPGASTASVVAEGSLARSGGIPAAAACLSSRAREQQRATR